MKLKYKLDNKVHDIFPCESYDNEIIAFESDAFPAGRRGYRTIKQFCAEWEDYEEPKGFWFINVLGIVEYQKTCDVEPIKTKHMKSIKYMESIGNIFSSKEDAEKAVEKLKVLKTLRDKGFKFNGWEESVHEDSNIIYCTIPNDSNIKASEMDLLFGGEE